MKMVSILFYFLAVTAPAQNPPKYETPPGVTVGKHRWQTVANGPGVDSSFKAESDSPGGANLSDPNSSSPDSGSPQRNSPSFMYSVEIKNDGNKSIKAVLWDYLITDSKTGEELGRHQFANVERIGRNAAKTLTVRSRVSPTQVVTVQASPSADKSAGIERVIFTCVVYDDETLWSQPGTAEGTCEALRQRAKK
jgi:hypothetical protein